MTIPAHPIVVRSALALALATFTSSLWAQDPPPSLAPRGGAEVTVNTVTFQGPSGGLDPEVIGSMVRGASEHLLDCYVPVLRALPTLGGDIVVNATVAHTGRVSEVTNNDLPSAADVSTCVARVVRGLTLPRFSQREPVHFRVAITLHPPAAERGTLEPPPATSNQRLNVVGLTHEVIRQTLRTYRGSVDHCIDRAAESTPDLAGRVTLHITVAPDGHVSDASVTDAPGDLGPVASCISSAATMWTFPSPMGGQPFAFDQNFPVNVVTH